MQTGNTRLDLMVRAFCSGCPCGCFGRPLPPDPGPLLPRGNNSFLTTGPISSDHTARATSITEAPRPGSPSGRTPGHQLHSSSPRSQSSQPRQVTRAVVVSPKENKAGPLPPKIPKLRLLTCPCHQPTPLQTRKLPLDTTLEQA